LALWPAPPGPLPPPPEPVAVAPAAVPVPTPTPTPAPVPPVEPPPEDSVRSLSMPPVPVVFADPRKRPPVTLRPRTPEPQPTKAVDSQPPKDASAPAKITVLTRSPSGARWANVYVDGQPRGSTPARLEVSPGRHLVLVERDGVRSPPREVNGVAGSVATVIFELGE
ncbi:MAG: PEGA domain-containing protein, partial [Myxococcaceae bacterium]|nr:PEGA domain-containing protein [Myxococcaceae bacterium]